MRNLTVVIPAAGSSRRFWEAGFRNPKQTLVVKFNGFTRSMLAHVEATVPDYSIVIGMKAEAFIPGDIRGVVVPIQETKGQADTILQIVRTLPVDNQVLVLDCDMLLPQGSILKLIDAIQVCDLSVAVTKTFDPNASRVDSIPFPTRFAEKEPISEFGIVSGRAFSNAEMLSEALERTLADCVAFGVEPYLSMAMNHYPGEKFALIVRDYVDWGTPERLKESGAEIV